MEVLLAQRRHHLCDPNRPRVAAREPHSPRAQIIPIGASRLAQDQVAGGVQIGGCARALSVDRAADDQGSAGRGVRRVRIFMHDRWRREHPVMRIRLGRRALHCARTPEWAHAQIGLASSYKMLSASRGLIRSAAATRRAWCVAGLRRARASPIPLEQIPDGGLGIAIVISVSALSAKGACTPGRPTCSRLDPRRSNSVNRVCPRGPSAAPR